MNKSRLICALAALAILVTLGATALPTHAAPSRPAAGCSGSGCNGQDPIAMGCANDAYTARSQALYRAGEQIGTVEMRWSPSCQTNWARASFIYGATNPTVELWTPNVNGSKVQSYTYTGTTYSVYGNMYYAPGVWVSACVADFHDQCTQPG